MADEEPRACAGRAALGSQRVALENEVLDFVRAVAGVPRQPCGSCAALPAPGLDARLAAVEQMDVCLVPSAGETDVASATRGEIDHVRQCRDCGQLYAWTYQYEFLVTGSETTISAYPVDLSAAAAFITERLRRRTGATCVHPASGTSVRAG